MLPGCEEPPQAREVEIGRVKAGQQGCQPVPAKDTGESPENRGDKGCNAIEGHQLEIVASQGFHHPDLERCVLTTGPGKKLHQRSQSRKRSGETGHDLELVQFSPENRLADLVPFLVTGQVAVRL